MFKRTIIVILSILLIVSGCTPKTKEELLHEGIKLMNENNSAGAIVLFKNALEKDQNYFEARFQLAKAYTAAGKYEQSEKEFQKVLRLNPSSSDIQIEVARLYIYVNKPEKAIDKATEYLESHPDSPEALEIVGQAYAIRNKFEDAEGYFLKTLKIDPERVSTKLGLSGLYIQKGNEKNARRLLNEILDKDKKNTKAYYALASLETSLGNKDKALQAYQKITEIEPGDINALYKSGLLYIDNRELDHAEKIADDLLKRSPRRPEGHSLKGLVFFYKKNFDGALVELQNSLKIQPAIGTYYFLGLTHYARGEFEQSLSQFQKVVDFNPSFMQARLLISTILLRQKRLDDAIAEAQRILKLDEENALAHNVLGSAYVAKGMFDEAMKEFNRAIELNPKLIDAHLKKGIMNLGKGKTKEAETELEAAVQVAPEILNTRLILFSYYMKKKDYNKAIKTLQGGITGNKADALLYNNISAVLFAQNKPSDALKYLQKAKEVNPDYFTPYFNLATYYAVKGDYEKARNEYSMVLKKDNKNITAMLYMASIFELKGRDNDALTYYRMARDTRIPAGYLAFANYFIRKKQPDKAIDVLDEAIKVNPRDAAAMELKGRIFQNEKEYKKAIKAFEALEAINPDAGLQLIVTTYELIHDYENALKKLEKKLKANPERIALMAEISKIYVLMKDMRGASEIAQRIINKKPDSSFGYMVLASVYEKQNDLNSATDVLKKGLTVDGKNLEARMMLANMYSRKKDFSFAISTYGDIVKRNPGYVPALFAQGSVYEFMGKRKQAINIYREVLEKSENYIPALNNLAYLYAEGSESKEEALRLAMKAYNLAPQNASIMDTLGYCLLKNNRKDDATKLLEKAVALLPDNPSVHYHLALAYKESGSIDKASKHLEEAIAKGNFPESAKAREILKKIKGK